VVSSAVLLVQKTRPRALSFNAQSRGPISDIQASTQAGKNSLEYAKAAIKNYFHARVVILLGSLIVCFHPDRQMRVNSSVQFTTTTAISLEEHWQLVLWLEGLPLGFSRSSLWRSRDIVYANTSFRHQYAVNVILMTWTVVSRGLSLPSPHSRLQKVSRPIHGGQVT